MVLRHCHSLESTRFSICLTTLIILPIHTMQIMLVCSIRFNTMLFSFCMISGNAIPNMKSILDYIHSNLTAQWWSIVRARKWTFPTKSKRKGDPRATALYTFLTMWDGKRAKWFSSSYTWRRTAFIEDTSFRNQKKNVV